MSRERKTGGISPEHLDKHAVNEIFAPVAATRYEVNDTCIRGALLAIEREKPYIPAEIRIANVLPMSETVAAEPAAAAAMAVSAAAEVQPVEPSAADPSDNLAVGELAHAAHNPNASDDRSMAARVLAAWRRSGPQHSNAIDPRALNQATFTEAPTPVQERHYVAELQNAVQAPSHLPRQYDDAPGIPPQPQRIEFAQAGVVQAFPMPAEHLANSLQPTYPDDMSRAA